MWRRAQFFAGLATWLCAAQSILPPERLLLVQIRERMKQNQQRIPNYTCLETITRTRRPPQTLVLSAKGGRGRFLSHDVVRVEVAEVNGREFFATPGARNFTETELSTFVNGGMIGNGLFVLFARDIFNPAIASYRFAGESGADGRKLVRYDFDVALLSSGYQLKTLRGTARVAYSGSFWADPQTLDTVRLDIRANGIPLELGLLAATNRIDYSTVRIGDTGVLLPQSAEMTMSQATGWDDRNTIAFTHCKEYGVTSAISFDAPAVEPSAAAAPEREVEVPAGLTVATALDTALDSETAAPGALVRAHVAADVKRRNKILIPKGTVVTGYIRRFEQYLTPTRRFLVALEFYRFEFPRGPVRFFADLVKIDPPLTIISTPDLPGVATFSVNGDSLRLAPGARMVWKTSRYSPGSP
jgi:hypothetical protein